MVSHESESRHEGPPEFTEGMEYYEELRQEPEWLEVHLNKYVAFIGRQLVGTEDTFSDLATKVRAEYGNGPMVMTQVTKEYPRSIKLGLRASGIRIYRKSDKQPS